MSNFANVFIINLSGREAIRLKKGMTKEEVILILGDTFREEKCKSKLNEKLIFKFTKQHLMNVSYTVLFIRQHLEYVAKLN